MEKLEFAKYYDITDFAKENSVMYNDYEKIYICVDTHTFWIGRIMKNVDEEYNTVEGAWLLERNNIEKDFKGQMVETTAELVEILDEDDLSNWDNQEVDDIEDAENNYLDDGFGLGELVKEDGKWISRMKIAA